MPQELYKIISLQGWSDSQKQGVVVPSPIDIAFFHLAAEEQVPHVAEKFWCKEDAYVLLKLDPARLQGELRYETNPGGSAKYYHLYKGRIPLDAVTKVQTIGNKKKCACHSGRPYGCCCGLYHYDVRPPHALALMRSRYCAYAERLAGYLMATTHPDSPLYRTDKKSWEKEILFFCNHTEFAGLRILDFIDGAEEAFVIFKASLNQRGGDASFTEKSRFLRSGGRWFYIDGVIV